MAAAQPAGPGSTRGRRLDAAAGSADMEDSASRLPRCSQQRTTATLRSRRDCPGNVSSYIALRYCRAIAAPNAVLTAGRCPSITLVHCIVVVKYIR